MLPTAAQLSMGYLKNRTIPCHICGTPLGRQVLLGSGTDPSSLVQNPEPQNVVLKGSLEVDDVAGVQVGQAPDMHGPDTMRCRH